MGRGILVPENFVDELPDNDDMNVASIMWGMTIGISIFNCGKAIRQTIPPIRRRKRPTFYNILCWTEIIVSIILGTVCWLYLRGAIPPSFPFFFCVSLFWSTQVQCLIQIIANRVGLLMVPRANATRLKWVCFLLLLAVNISVICIWVPARLQISDKFIYTNQIWDRVEKVIFALMDAALNSYFIFVVKRHLVANGLHKYNRLYRMNIMLMIVSVALDITLIGIMSLPNDLVYLQFHPVVYLLKLHIEMKMADLIGKVVKASNIDDEFSLYVSRTRTAVDTVPSNPDPPQERSFARGTTKMMQDDEIELTRNDSPPRQSSATVGRSTSSSGQSQDGRKVEGG